MTYPEYQTLPEEQKFGIIDSLYLLCRKELANGHSITLAKRKAQQASGLGVILCKSLYRDSERLKNLFKANHTRRRQRTAWA